MGLSVCRKYGIKFRPWARVSYSCASYEIRGIEKGNLNYTIWCSVTDKTFISSLFHELAHCLDYKHTRFRNISFTPCDEERVKRRTAYRRILKAEVRANKYAIRMLKSSGKWTKVFQNDIEWAMTSYMQYLDKSVIADFHYNTMKYLRGDKCEKSYVL